VVFEGALVGTWEEGTPRVWDAGETAILVCIMHRCVYIMERARSCAWGADTWDQRQSKGVDARTGGKWTAES